MKLIILSLQNHLKFLLEYNEAIYFKRMLNKYLELEEIYSDKE